MKPFLKIFSGLLFITLSLFGGVLALQTGRLNNQIAKGIIYYFNHKQINLEIQDLSFKNNNLKIRSLTFDLNARDKIKLGNLSVIFNFSNFLHNFTVKILEVASDLALVNKDTELFNATILGDAEISSLGVFKKYNFRTTKESQGLNFTFKKNGINDLKVFLKVVDTPLSFFHILDKFFPHNVALSYFMEHITEGVINKGELNIDLGLNDIYGKFEISGLNLLYNPDLPPVERVNTSVELAGANIKLNLKKAYIVNTPITDGIINVNYSDLDNVNIDIKAKAKGKVSDLTRFISEENLKDLRKKNIDLSKIKGNAQTDIAINIPCKKGTENIYNIITKSSDITLSVFDDNVVLSKAKIEGIFDGDNIKVLGVGKINNFDSTVDLNYALSGKNNKGELNLAIKTDVIARNQKLDFLKLITGKAELNLEYRKKENDKPQISLTSDLKNLEFFIDKFFIHKALYEKAFLKLDNNKEDESYNINITGSNNLNISGKIIALGDILKLNFSKIRHNLTNLKAKIEYVKNRSVDAEISGPSLDLIKAEMGKFLGKDTDTEINSKVSIDINKVYLKNDIILNSLNAKIVCKKDKCYKGYLDSRLGNNQSFNIHLLNSDLTEKWVISTEDAGSILKGLGIYNKMKGGKLTLYINPKSSVVTKGQKIPIIEGYFVMKDFVIQNNPFLTRLVSFMSLPGIANAIINRKDISFTNMQGKFSYSNNNFNIYDNLLQGPYMILTMGGNIDMYGRIVKLKGKITPSFYGLNSLARNIPLIGKLLPGRNPNGIISMPYSIIDRY